MNTDGSSDYSKIIYLQRTITTWVQLYPNPVRDLLQVQFSRPFNNPVELRLVNSKGQTVRSRMVIASQLQLSLPVSDLAAGVYQLVIYREDSILETKRVLVNR